MFKFFKNICFKIIKIIFFIAYLSFAEREDKFSSNSFFVGVFGFFSINLNNVSG